MNAQRLKHKLRYLSNQIGLAVVVGYLVIFISFVVYINLMAGQDAFETAESDALHVAQELRFELAASLLEPVVSVEQLARSLSDLSGRETQGDKRALALGMCARLLESERLLRSLRMAWEPDAFDGQDTSHVMDTGSDGQGRFMPELSKLADDFEPRTMAPINSLSAPWYAEAKLAGVPLVGEPWLAESIGSSSLLVRVVVPIARGGRFAGAIALDMDASFVQEFVQAKALYEGQARVNVISNQGTFLAVFNRPELLGRNLREFSSSSEHRLGHINSGREHVQFDDGMIEVYLPLLPTPDSAPWQVAVAISPEVLSQIHSHVLLSTWRSVGIGVVAIAVVMFFMITWIRRLLAPLNGLARTTRSLSRGELDCPAEEGGAQEIATIADSLREISQSLAEKERSVRAITQGQFEHRLEVKFETDLLGKAIRDMAENFKEAKAMQELREKEEKTRSWMEASAARFSEILRENSADLEVLSDILCREFSTVLGMDIVGIFLVEDEEPPYLRLYASLAYDRRRRHRERIELEEGLVGRCVFQKKTVLLTEIPDDYIQISSGLGEHRPNHLLIVPLKVDEKVVGAVEMACLRPIPAEHVSFAERVAASIASSVGAVRSNMNNRRLLERSNEQQRELAEKEELLRMNLEEMQATQEAAFAKEKKYRSLLTAINQRWPVVRLDRRGQILVANPVFLRAFGLAEEALEDKSLDQLDALDWDDGLRLALEAVAAGRAYDLRHTVGGRQYLFSFMPVVEESGPPVEFLVMALPLA